MDIKLRPIHEQVMVITGASSGIGLTTALGAAELGAKVVLVARSAQTISAVVDDITGHGGEAIAVSADVADRHQLQNVAEAAINKWGRIDTWVNDAGSSIYGKIEDISEEDARRLFDTNFWGVVNGSVVALPHLRRDGGALINLGSEASEAPLPLLEMYAASKYAVKGFTDCLRIEVQQVDRSPVAVTVIQPTATDTPFDEHGKNYMEKEPNLPPPRIEPEQVADAILDAAVHPRRDVKVGLMSKANTFVAKHLPRLGDRLAAMRVRQLKRDEPPQRPREGNLHHAGEANRQHGDH